jgi:U3 small nucleolar RNA-associated protein 7
VVSQLGISDFNSARCDPVQVHIWKDGLQIKQKTAYLHHTAHGNVSSLRFCPYEDVLAIGHSAGLSTMLVPGAGEPNFDSLVANPYQTAKARRQQEVHQLLDKLPADMIALDPSNIAKVRRFLFVMQPVYLLCHCVISLPTLDSAG